jgi:hypothetical protein
MRTIIKLLEHLKKNWIRYGFETFTIVVGIFGAFTIENWSDSRQQHKHDIDFLRNLRAEIVLDTSILSRQRIRFNRINNQIEKTLYYFDNNLDLSQGEYKLIGLTIIRLEQLIPVQQNVLRNEQMISEGVLSRIDKELSRKFLSYLEKIKMNNSIITKFREILLHIMVQDIHPRVDLNYTNPQKLRVMYDFNKIRKDRMVRNTLNKSYNYRKVYISVIEDQIVVAIELLSMIDTHLNE